MVRWIATVFMLFPMIGSANAAASLPREAAAGFLAFTGMPGRPAYDMVQAESSLACDQLRCNGLRTGQLPFSGPTSGGEETCSIQDKSILAPFFAYEENRFFHVISSRGELWKFNHRLQLRDRFGRARFPASEGIRIQEGTYLFVGSREISLRQASGNVLWRESHAAPTLWFPPLRISEQMVLVHGNVPASPTAGRTASPRAVMRLVQVSTGKTLMEVPLGGHYAPRRFPALAVLQNQKIILPDPYGGLVAFSLTDLLKKKNRVLWRTKFLGTGQILSIVADPSTARLYAAYAGNRGQKNLAAFDTETGASVWAISNETISTPLALYGGTLLFGTQTGRIVGLKTTDGKVVMDAAPELNLAPDDETRVMAVSEPVVDSMGRVYVAFAAVGLELARKLALNRNLADEPLEDSVEVEVVGVQAPGKRLVYRSSIFELQDLQYWKLLVGMEFVGLFGLAEQLYLCSPEGEDDP